MLTGHAAELFLQWAVGFVGMTALCAPAAGVARIDQYPMDACQLRFILDKATQLINLSCT